MNNYKTNIQFIIYLGITIMATIIGIVTKEAGETKISLISFVVVTIATTITLLLTLNSEFFQNMNKYALAWIFSAISFGITAFYMKKLGKEYESVTLIFATMSTISIISIIGYGIYPSNTRARALLTIGLNLAVYIPVTWLILGGLTGIIQMSDAPIADQTINVIAKNVKTIDTIIIILKSIFKGGPIKINGVLSFPHVLLLLHIGWNFFKFMRSYGWIFIVSAISTPFLVVAWKNHIPRSGIWLYFGISISLIVSITFVYSLLKHWNMEAK